MLGEELQQGEEASPSEETLARIEVHHFRRFLNALTSVAGGVSLFEGLGYVLYGERWILLSSITLLGYFLLLFFGARVGLNRGAIDSAVKLTYFGLLVTDLLYVVIVPALYPVLIGVPLLVVAMALPFASVRGLRKLAAMAWLSTVVIAVIAVWQQESVQLSPFLRILNPVGVACVSLLVLMLLLQYRSRSGMHLETLQRMNESLRHANSELEAFSYSVSHDLRAPLRAIDGYSDALLEDYQDKLDDMGVQYLNNLRRGANRMGRLIDDLLSLGQVNRKMLKRTELNLSEVAARVIQEAQPADSVQIQIEPNLRTYADQALVEVLLSNLIGNALKFSARADSPLVSLRKEGEPSEEHFVVADNGVGFDMRYVDKLFKPFQRLHTDKEFPGTGIGLATCARVVQKHGGKIWATASVGKGAAIHFSLSGEEER